MGKTLILGSLVLLAFVASTHHPLAKANAVDSAIFTQFNVLHYGAVGDGKTNDTKLAASALSLHPSSPLQSSDLPRPIATLRPPPPPPPARAPPPPPPATGTNSSAALVPGGSGSSSRSNSSGVVDSGVSSNSSDVTGSVNSNSTSVDSPPTSVDSSSSSNSSGSLVDTSDDSSNASVISDAGDSNSTSSSVSTAVARTTEFNVLKYGAEGDGETNDTQAFADAWTAACATEYAYVHAPVGYKFLVYPIKFEGPCLLNMILKVDGTVMAPSDPNVWTNAATSTNYWLAFSKVSMTVQGKGSFDGQGQTWWAESCKINASNPCKDGPTAVVFDTCTNVTVKNVNIINSQQMHLGFQKSSGITVNSINISAPGDSPNTDGIHVSRSTSVTIKNSFIGTGDDCVSIQNGSSIITIKNITCGPGHGISVGGLGKSNTTATVSNIVVQDVVFTNSTNGVRIKSWQGSSGTASTFTYQNLKMNNVKYPILIDQYYCDSANSGSCPNYTSNVAISGITYKNITGTSATKVAIKLACSETVACTGITLQNIDLVQTSGSAATSFCTDAYGSTANTIIPSSCLIKST